MAAPHRILIELHLVSIVPRYPVLAVAVKVRVMSNHCSLNAGCSFNVLYLVCIAKLMQSIEYCEILQSSLRCALRG